MIFLKEEVVTYYLLLLSALKSTPDDHIDDISPECPASRIHCLAI